MRFEVPQFIEIEDKIFGPFTWKQFVYLAGGVGFAAVLFFTASKVIFVLFGLPIGGLAALLAFYQVNNRPFSGFLESVMRYFSNSKLYLWKRTGTGIYNDQNVPTDQPTEPAYVPRTGQGNINSLARQLELKAIQKQN
jgi:hypothetical protein